MEVIAMVISAVIGFVAGVVATILIREAPRPFLSRQKAAVDTGPNSAIEQGWGHVETRANPIVSSAASAAPSALDLATANVAPGIERLATSANPQAAINATTRHGAPIAMLEAQSLGKRWLLRSGESASIGRFDDNVIAIDDEEVSRLHAQISHRTDTGEVHEFAIFDYTSTNGTLVNGNPIRGVTSLQDGDIVKIGNTELSFRRVRRE